MTRFVRTVLLVPVIGMTATACALGLGGAGPEDYTAAAIRADANTSAAAVAEQIGNASADIVLLSAPRDSAWFAGVAGSTQLTLSGPGTTSGTGLAFLTSLEMLGDTSLVLGVDGGGEVHVHDALYQISGERFVDLMLVRMDASDMRSAVRQLLSYIATDVSGSAALLLAIDAPTAQAADSAAVLVRATLGNAAECGGLEATAPTATIRLLYGPSARLTCRSARRLPDGIVANVQVQR